MAGGGHHKQHGQADHPEEFKGEQRKVIEVAIAGEQTHQRLTVPEVVVPIQRPMEAPRELRCPLAEPTPRLLGQMPTIDMQEPQQEHHHTHVTAVEQQGVKQRIQPCQWANREGQMQQDVGRTAVGPNRCPVGLQWNIGGRRPPVTDPHEEQEIGTHTG